MNDPVTAARERLERLLPDVLRYDPVSMPAFDQRIDALIEAVRAEAGVSMTLPGSDELARTFHEQYERLAPSFGYVTRRDSSVPWEDVPEPNRSLMLAVATEVLERWPALAARSAGSGSRVERECVCGHGWADHGLTGGCEAEWGTGDGDVFCPCTHTRPTPPPCEWRSKGDEPCVYPQGHPHGHSTVSPTPAPAVDGTRCAECGGVKDDVFHVPCLVGGPFHYVKTCHPFTPPTPDPAVDGLAAFAAGFRARHEWPTPAPADRLRALEEALRDWVEEVGLHDACDPDEFCSLLGDLRKKEPAARDLLADGERSDG